MPYEIGAVIWRFGDEYGISSEPYLSDGAEWQDATIINAFEGCKPIVAVPTPEQEKVNVAASQNEWREHQDGFRRLRGGC